MRYEITAPHEGDEQLADITFADGRATATDPGEGLLLYLRRHGYTLDVIDDPQPEQDTENGPPSTKPAGRSAARNKRG
ncbi:hypothetical protein ACFVQ0_36375 [Streptomyces sp. NPDC057900]|uniref:hypothetical protein n=1 Tax=Streptomyces sp. NPDC057900 TaxID=3346274 RepID=UPI0036EB2E48